MESKQKSKKLYSQPAVEHVFIDNEISLVLLSGPGDAGSNMDIKSDPFNNNHDVFLA